MPTHGAGGFRPPIGHSGTVGEWTRLPFGQRRFLNKRVERERTDAPLRFPVHAFGHPQHLPANTRIDPRDRSRSGPACSIFPMPGFDGNKRLKKAGNPLYQMAHAEQPPRRENSTTKTHMACQTPIVKHGTFGNRLIRLLSTAGDILPEQPFGTTPLFRGSPLPGPSLHPETDGV